MANKNVQLPDGRVVAFPDSMDDESISSVLRGEAQKSFHPSASMGAAPPQTTLQQAEQDFSQGGNRTALGRILGTLQGRGDKGYSGINSGVSPETANFMGSPGLGLIHAGEAAQTIPKHPIRGPLGVVGGLAEALTIPGMVLGGPGTRAAIDAVPSTKYAGQVLNQVAEGMNSAGATVPLNNALKPLSNIGDLSRTGTEFAKAPRQLLGRALSGQTTLPYDDARNFYSNISQLSADEAMKLKPIAAKAVGELRAGLHSDIGAAADAIGQGDAYRQAIKEYAQASSLKDKAALVAKWAARAGITGALGVGGYSAYKKVEELAK